MLYTRYTGYEILETGHLEVMSLMTSTNRTQIIQLTKVNDLTYL